MQMDWLQPSALRGNETQWKAAKLDKIIPTEIPKSGLEVRKDMGESIEEMKC